MKHLAASGAPLGARVLRAVGVLLGAALEARGHAYSLSKIARCAEGAVRVM